MNDHITEQTLEIFFLAPQELPVEDRKNLESHLAECALCREHAQKLEAFYRELQETLQTSPSEEDVLLARRLSGRPRLALGEGKPALTPRPDNAMDFYRGFIEPYRPPLLQRYIHYARTYPLGFTAANLLAAALLALFFVWVKPGKDTNLAYARAKEEFLVVYNRNGEELWKKHIGPDYDQEIFRASEFGYDPEDYLKTIDVDGDGKQEIIAIFGMGLTFPMKNTLVCYNDDGTERWKYGFHRQMTFGENPFSDDYHFLLMMVGDFDKNGAPDVVAVAQHDNYYPTAILRLNASDGTLLQEYWVSGNLLDIVRRDIDGDGIEELFFAGQNNGYDAAALLVLDPRYMSGHAPAPLSGTPLNIPEGREKYYILFSRSDLEKIADQKRNVARHLTFTNDGLLQIGVYENIAKRWYPLLYYFNTKMECVKVDGEDAFVTLHRKMEAEGKLTRKLDEQYYEELRQGVRYWDGEAFVKVATMNKKYQEITTTTQ